ncbi:TetR/AcrR family transcriptional regulator [Rhizobium paknamense]|uniref:AcrR family transcriptional regulator n=1 Tax=Rhizobium paknamense TaxID=1206817 RepID=A0ABU0IA08_9HYPH|nr:TetR/AcrR family transcriptional regulator [Rhizobium paknamense]MDQ0454310.1 AcrR family transcriptional regulator [Rhizobium paknamense]
MQDPEPDGSKAKRKAQSRAGRPRLGAETGRETILCKALDGFARRGYEGVNIRDLARQAGVNIALANYHYGSKAALWEACLERLRERAAPSIEELTAIAASGLPYGDRLCRFYAAFIRFNAALPEYGLFILQEMVQAGERQAQVKVALVDPFHDVTLPLLQEGIALGLIPPQDASLLFFTHSIAISHVVAGQGLIASFLEAQDRREQTLAELLRTMIRSITGVLPQDFEQALANA